MKNIIVIFVLSVMFVSCIQESDEITDTSLSPSDRVVELTTDCGLTVCASPLDSKALDAPIQTYELSVQDKVGTPIATGTLVLYELENEIKEYVYSDTGELLFTYISKSDGAEDVVVYNEEIETLALDVSHGFRKRGEKYFACVSRVSDEFIKSYEETKHRVVQRVVHDFLVAGAALYAGVVGCTKYEDEWL